MHHDERIDIDAALVRRLIAAQFPEWAELSVAPVQSGGWDNRMFRLGERMVARLPSAACYAAQVEKEQRWLPFLAPRLPVAIPAPLAMGAPCEDFPWSWSVYEWLDGEAATITERIADLNRFAIELAEFLAALQRIDVEGGPAPGPHNFFRGGPLSIYDGETRDAIARLEKQGDHDGDPQIDIGAAMEVWDAALAAEWRGGAPGVWIHGDVSAGNLLVEPRGRLCAVIDFGLCGVGDPACDLAVAWTLFDRESRDAFRAALPLDDDDDDATWSRGRGWALWKALITLARAADVDAGAGVRDDTAKARRVIDEVIADYGRGG